MLGVIAASDDSVSVCGSVSVCVSVCVSVSVCVCVSVSVCVWEGSVDGECVAAV